MRLNHADHVWPESSWHISKVTDSLVIQQGHIEVQGFQVATLTKSRRTLILLMTMWIVCLNAVANTRLQKNRQHAWMQNTAVKKKRRRTNVLGIKQARLMWNALKEWRPAE